MRQQAWDEVKTALYDYPKTDWYLNQLRQNKLFPYVPNDLNKDFKGGGYSPDGIVNKVISIHDDILYRRLSFQRDTIQNELENSEKWLKDLITLMYLNPTKLKLKPASELVGKSWRTAKAGHEEFMENLARRLGILTIEEE